MLCFFSGNEQLFFQINLVKKPEKVLSFANIKHPINSHYRYTRKYNLKKIKQL